MKKIVLAIFFLGFLTLAFSQSDKYKKAMEQRIQAFDTTRSIAGWQDLGNAFERIATVEKSQWLPYYYAALCHTMAGYTMSNGNAMGTGGATDPEAAKAEAMIGIADSLQKNNSEIYCVKKMIATLFMLGDPQTRYATYGPEAAESLVKAKELNPDNPRVYLLEAQDKFYTPEQFGGDKEEAKKLLGESEKKFETYKPDSELHPNWGKTQIVYLKTQMGN